MRFLGDAHVAPTVLLGGFVLFLLVGGFEWFSKGGWAMYPLLALSVWSLFVILNRAVYFATQQRALNRDLDSVARGISLLPERLNGELAPLLARGMKDGRLNTGRADLAIEHELLDAARLVPSLDTVAQVAPMFGLLGTVTGMVQVFQSIAAQQGAVNPSTLAAGIWQALLTTVFGLIIGIPAYMTYRYFRTRLTEWEAHLRTVVDDVSQIIAQGGVRERPAVEGHPEALPVGAHAATEVRK
jgi:biopolymer transport protein ExbB